jgi:hypothetical protein
MTNRWVWAVAVAAGWGSPRAATTTTTTATAALRRVPAARDRTVFFDDVHSILGIGARGVTAIPWRRGPADAQFGADNITTAYNATFDAVNTTTPAESLLIQKGDGQVTHGGGDRLDPAHVTSITTWITECAQNNARPGVP